MDFSKEFQDIKEKATPLNALKFVTGTIISLGTAAAVVALFKDPIKNARSVTKIMMKLGVFVLGCKVGDVAEKYFNDTVDETVKTFKEAQEEMQHA